MSAGVRQAPMDVERPNRAAGAALADVETAARLAPDDADVQAWLINAAVGRRDFAGALALRNRLLAGHPENTGNLLAACAQIEGSLGKKAEMDADFVRAQGMLGAGAAMPYALCAAEIKARWRPEETLKNCETALRTFPKSTSLRLGNFILLHHLGRTTEALAMLGAVETENPDADTLNSVCYDLAVENIALDRALSDCDASLTRRPGNAETLDSRAFVLMRLGRDAEALSAYDAALAVDNRLYTCFYGRGLVEARLGRHADIAAALAGSPHIREQFAEYGIL